jgi:hypothetical protein
MVDNTNKQVPMLAYLIKLTYFQGKLDANPIYKFLSKMVSIDE